MPFFDSFEWDGRLLIRTLPTYVLAKQRPQPANRWCVSLHVALHCLVFFLTTRILSIIVSPEVKVTSLTDLQDWISSGYHGNGYSNIYNKVYCVQTCIFLRLGEYAKAMKRRTTRVKIFLILFRIAPSLVNYSNWPAFIYEKCDDQSKRNEGTFIK